ncbi:par-3 family cell polarity regulator beta a isoform X3 [Phyllopteryx taeniolatus]|uniref:par-3 family cell polarity regulator beta a isoform X3 n=1 Tax=Phyllopteryx taeniolatus TaxID=161469 RepID=UPI002AD2431C|nr:par-3 family cell polarity regulator beta a isoform X3 [Phyllopteryx taeniolatus]
MKVTVTFGNTVVVVPCKPEWTVRDLIDQSTRRYRRTLDQHGRSAVKTHHLEYTDGGILDMDDLLTDLVEDRDKLVAMFEVQRGMTDSPKESISNGDSSAAPSPEPLSYYSHMHFQEPIKGEIEVNEAVLKANTPLLVRSSSDSVLAPPIEMTTASTHDDQTGEASKMEINHVLKGGPKNLNKMSQITFSSTLTRTVNLLGDRGPLGIQVSPYCSSLSGRMLGLHIKNIEDNSRTKRENIFEEDECIVQINGIQLQDKTFADSQEVFREALSSPSMHLEVVPVADKPRYEKGLIGQLFSGDGKDFKAKSPMVTRPKIDLRPVPKQDSKPNEVLRRQDTGAKTPEPPLLNPEATPVNPLSADSQYGNSQSERISPTPPVRTTSFSPSRSRRQSHLENKNSGVPGPANLTNKKGGKRIKIDLKKGAEGLGFTVVTPDSSASGPGPILVKNILPRGAAIKDGRLQPGDCILEVNGMDMTGRSQEELVAMLRSTKQGESVSVIVARQEDIFLPRELKGEDGGSLVLEDGREQLMYEVPLNETGSAGLGVSLKGNKSRETGEDLGIFIKSIIHGGAAYKDGRLRVNDQLIAVNGEALLGRSNHSAMETLRRSMSSEGNARGTIQLVVLRASKVEGQSNAINAGTNQATPQQSSDNQEPQHHQAYQGASRPSELNSANLSDKYAYGGSGSALFPVVTTNGNHDFYGNNQKDSKEGFPPPPSPGTVEEMSRDPALTPSNYSERSMDPRNANHKDNIPRNRASKSMDLVADESNVRSLAGHRKGPTDGGTLGPTLGLWKSSSLESLQSAMSEVHHNDIKAQVPFHRPQPHMVRGRGCNQSFRIAIDKSYEGPSEDDDDMSELSSGHETPASSSSRQDLDIEDVKKQKKVSGKKQEKKTKGIKRSEDAANDMEKKTKKKGFALLRFGRKRDDKSKDAVKVAKNKLEAWSEEEVDRFPEHRESYDPRYAEIHSGQLTPDSRFIPDLDDDYNDPNYAQISNFLQPNSVQLIDRTHSPATPVTVETKQSQASADELEGLYAKVNKSRQQTESDQRSQGMRREYPQARAAPVYEELETARRRLLESNPRRVAPSGAESRPLHLYEELDWPPPTHTRRDPHDYPIHSRFGQGEPVHNQDHYRDKRQSVAQSATSNLHHYRSSPHAGQQYRVAMGQDGLPSPTTGRKERHYYESVGSRGASPGRYASPDRYGYRDERQSDPRRKNPMIGAV